MSDTTASLCRKIDALPRRFDPADVLSSNVNREAAPWNRTQSKAKRGE
jgi:hypothetical protein